MRIVDKLYVENHYSGSNWDFEKTTKYIIQTGDFEIEAGYFEHYKDGILVKNVIELPQSYGCPSKCRFCATSSIERFQVLDAVTLEKLFDLIYRENNLQEQKYVLLTMTGMGDIFFNYDNIELFLLKLQKYDNLYITLSSCLWNTELLKRIENLSRLVRIRNIQITFVTEDINILSWMIPYYQEHEFQFKELIKYIRDSKETFYRINYIVIKDVNDSGEAVDSFAESIDMVKDKVLVRISKLNETNATRKNSLQTTDIQTLENMQRALHRKEIHSYIFYADKNDNMNCGQLITEK